MYFELFEMPVDRTDSLASPGSYLPATGVNPLRGFRLAIPGRVYTQNHMDYVIEAILQVHQRRRLIRRMKIAYEAPFLRYFTARFQRDG